jgi:rSAM/selenodomain-associated transferase 1
MTRLIVVFGREPIPGRVKTRLARDIGEDRAAEIYTRLLEHTLTEATATGIGVVLSLAEPLTGRWTPPQGLQIEVQGEGDLGRRMAQSFRSHFALGAQRVLLIGSDCPGVTRAHLRNALDALSSAPVVLGPARDGGYWAIAQQAPGVDCFSGVPWSSERTLEITRERLGMLGVDWAEIETLDDVDTGGDLGLLDGMAEV